LTVRENPKGNKEIQESREMSEVVFMLPNTFSLPSQRTEQDSFIIWKSFVDMLDMRMLKEKSSGDEEDATRNDRRLDSRDVQRHILIS